MLNTPEQTNDFIRSVLKGHWPDWEPNKTEAGMWCDYLTHIDLHRARQLVYQWVSDAASPGKRPIIGKLKPVLNKAYLHHDAQKPTKGPYILYGLTRTPDMPRGPGSGYREFAWPTLPSPDRCAAMAENMRAHYATRYGGEWYVIRLWEPQEPSPLSTPESRSRILIDMAAKGDRFAQDALDRKLKAESAAFVPANIVTDETDCPF